MDMWRLTEKQRDTAAKILINTCTVILASGIIRTFILGVAFNFRVFLIWFSVFVICAIMALLVNRK